MRRLKIFITIFILYEFIMITLLHKWSYCSALFNDNFCLMNNFKYFLLCVMVPVFILLLFWWLPDIYKLFDKTEPKKPKSFRDILFDIVPEQYLKRLIIAIVIVGVRQFVMKYPHAKDFFENVSDVLKKKSTL